MTIMWWRTKRTLGIEIKDDALKLVEVEKSRQSAVITQAAMIQLPYGVVQEGQIRDEGLLQESLRRLLKEHPIKAKTAQIALHSDQVFLRPLAMPPLPPKAMRKAIVAEIENNIQLPFEDYVFDYAELPPSFGSEEEESKKEILLVIAPRPVIDQYIRVIEKCGLKVIGVDLAPLAILRVLEQDSGQPLHEPLITVDVGHAGAEVSIFYERFVRLTRSIPLSFPELQGNTGEAPAAQSLHLASELAQEIERILNFYLYTLNNRNQRIHALYLTGEPASLSVIARVLSDQLQIPAVIPTVQQIDMKPAVRERLLPHTPSFLVPLGLALKDVSKRGN